MTAQFDPYSGISFLELNKKRWGRSEVDRVESRYQKPAVKKIYLWKNGEDLRKRPKLFIWRQWQSPKLENLLSEVGPYVGIEGAAGALYDINGTKIESEDDVIEKGLYFVAGEERLQTLPVRESASKRVESPERDQRHTSMSAPEYSASRNSYYDNDSDVSSSPPPRPRSSYLPQNKSKQSLQYQRDPMEEFQRYYEEALKPSYSRAEGFLEENDVDEDELNVTIPTPEGQVDPDEKRKAIRRRSQSDNNLHSNSHRKIKYNDIEDSTTLNTNETRIRPRSSSRTIYNRRDQTHPDAYIIYVFLNGHGMESQFMNFQKHQLQKGMAYVLELIARKFSIKPARLCNMDGRKITDISQLMSRGAYIIVPAGQQFRDTWYFLPDNAIDTSTNQQKVEDRSAQRDRLIQRREKREGTKNRKKRRSKTGPVKTTEEPFTENKERGDFR